MHRLARFLDPRHTIEGKIVTAILLIVLVFSMVNLSTIVEFASAAGSNDSGSNNTELNTDTTIAEYSADDVMGENDYVEPTVLTGFDQQNSVDGVNQSSEENNEIIGTPSEENSADVSESEESKEESSDNDSSDENAVMALSENAEEPLQPQDKFTIAMIGSSEYGTLQEAIDAAQDGDKITLCLDSAQNLTIRDKNNLTLDLNGHTVTKFNNSSDKGTASVLLIENSNVTLTGEGLVTGAGKKITTVYESSINGGPFEKRVGQQSVSTNKEYRVITAQNSNLTLDGPNVSNNYRTTDNNYPLKEPLDPIYGGAVLVKDGDLTIKNGTIDGGVSSSRNTSILYGATIAVSNGDFNMSGGTIVGFDFYRTYGTRQGGSLYVAGTKENPSDVKITGGIIKNTKKGKKTTNGGNLALIDCNTEISGDVQIQNGYASTGGNIYANRGKLTISGGVISGGKATGSDAGAGIYALNADVTVSGGVIENNESTFKNKATNYTKGGGGLSVVGSSSNFTMTGGIVRNNTTNTLKGAGSYLGDCPSINITGGCVEGNKATGADTIGGGVFASSTKDVNISIGGATVTGNVAAYGAGVAVEGSKNVVFDLSESARIYNNDATKPANENTGTNTNKTDELYFKNSSKIQFKQDGNDAPANVSGVAGYEGRQFNIDGVDYEYLRFDNNNEVSYFCKKEIKIAKEDCVEDAIYLDPKHDENHPAHYIWNEEDGKAYPVEPETNLVDAIAKANELHKPIVVCSQASVKDSDISGVTIKRCSANNIGSILTLDGHVSFSDATIDGASVSTDAALLYAKNGSDIAFNNNTVVKGGNRIKSTGSYVGGAALEMAYGQTSSTLTIDGATFENNKNSSSNGGAIWVWHTNTLIKGGAFSHNGVSNGAYAEGGFLCAIGGSTLSIEGGNFDSNSSSGQGGAISLLRATNTAVTKGTITGGVFTNNVSTRPVVGYYYGGGAVYNDYNCELEIYNALITGNTESSHSNFCHKGAVANCRSGSIEVYKYEGMLAYGNQTSSWQDNNADIAFCDSTCPHFGDVNHAGFVTVSDYALGGGDCNWTRFDGSEADQTYYQNTQNSFKINSHPSEQTIAWANEHAKVRFEKNHADGAGSAIMNNGKLTFGGDKKNLRVTKEWFEQDSDGNKVPSTEKPTSVKVQLAQKVGDDIVPVEESTRKDAIQTLNEENGWEAYWADLGTQSDWTIVEMNVPGYESELSQPSDDEVDGIPRTNYVLTNTWNDERTNISTEKIWQDSDNLYQIRPDQITVKLAIDSNNDGMLSEDELDAETVQTANITPNEEGIWRWEFTDLPKYTKKGEEIKYLINETPVNGYKSDVVYVQATDDQGQPLVDNAGNPIYNWKDADNKEWSAVNVVNSLDLVDLSLEKKYEGAIFQDLNGNGSSTAVFRITGSFNGNDFYNNIVSADFTNEDSQQLELNKLLIGATYSIQELTFDGSGYTAVGNSKTFTLTKEYLDELEENKVVATFTNESQDKETPNQGAINKYTFTVNGIDVEKTQQSRAA